MSSVLRNAFLAKLGISSDVTRKPGQPKLKAVRKKPTPKQRTDVKAKPAAKKATTKASRGASTARAE